MVGVGWHLQNIFEVFASCSLFKRMPTVAGCLLIGLPWGHNKGDQDNDGSPEWSLSSSSSHQATVSQIAWHKSMNQWGEHSKCGEGGRGVRRVWNESFSLLLLLLSIHCKAMSHSEELSLLLTDRLSKKQFPQLLHQQGTLTETRPGETNSSLLEMRLSDSPSTSEIEYYHNTLISCEKGISSRWISSSRMTFRTDRVSFNIK